jgi:hypothetical protein
MYLREIVWEGVNWIHLTNIVGFSEHGYERSVSIDDTECLDQPRDYHRVED